MTSDEVMGLAGLESLPCRCLPLAFVRTFREGVCLLFLVHYCLLALFSNCDEITDRHLVLLLFSLDERIPSQNMSKTVNLFLLLGSRTLLYILNFFFYFRHPQFKCLLVCVCERERVPQNV